MGCFFKKENTNDCLSGNTLIRMDDENEKRIADIRPGDRIKTYDETKVVRDVITGIEMTLIDIVADTGQNILLTQNHPVLTNRGVIRASDLIMGDKLITESHKEAALLQISVRDSVEMVYNLGLDDNSHLFVANKFWVGDINYQNQV